jgi:DNA-binding PadR family transcriptional regulator
MSRDYSPSEMDPSRSLTSGPRTNERNRRSEESRPEDTRGAGAENRTQPDNPLDREHSDARPIESRRSIEHRGRIYRLRSSEIHAMTEIGKFRALAAKDLEEFAYGGNQSHLEADLANLRRQGLIAERQVPHRDTPPRRLIALTKQGHRSLVARNTVSKDQALYYGFSKPREAHHDADLYRLHQKALADIARKGGHSVRVVLDSELKRVVYRDLAKAGREGQSEAVKNSIAEKHGLQVIRGKIPVPDLRIEYETPEHEPARVDLELATENYRFRNLAEKARAGFSMHARPDELSKLRRVMDERGIIAEIMSL